MGKRKTKVKAAPVKRPWQQKLDTVFTCPFCCHGDSVDCFIDKKKMVGEVVCRVCQQNFLTSVTALTEPIDLYSEWIDECERVNTAQEDA